MARVVEELEDRVTDAEEDLGRLEAELSTLPAGADVLALTRRHQEMQETLEGLMAAWEENSSALESLRQMQTR